MTVRSLHLHFKFTFTFTFSPLQAQKLPVTFVTFVIAPAIFYLFTLLPFYFYVAFQIIGKYLLFIN